MHIRYMRNWVWSNYSVILFGYTRLIGSNVKCQTTTKLTKAAGHKMIEFYKTINEWLQLLFKFNFFQVLFTCLFLQFLFKLYTYYYFFLPCFWYYEFPTSLNHIHQETPSIFVWEYANKNMIAIVSWTENYLRCEK